MSVRPKPEREWGYFPNIQSNDDNHLRIQFGTRRVHHPNGVYDESWENESRKYKGRLTKVEEELHN